ncbi:DNA topoisomerase VI subunit B [archaeon]|nr:DNA topoisomerase VI subunit B [archaeon]
MEEAEEIFKEFKEHSVAEFFKKNRQMLGYSGKIRSLTTVIHEYVTNALDACEEAGILPELEVTITQLGNDHYRITSKDNGPGIPKKHMGKVFAQMLAGTKFHRFIQQRGQQGIGCTGCTMFAQITSGKPTHVETNTGKGKTYIADIMIDVKRNSATINNEKEIESPERGTKIIAEYKNIAFTRGDYGAGEYIRRTAIANPHAKIIFKDPNNQRFVYERAVSVLPARPTPGKPHPKGLDVDDLVSYAHSSQERTLKTFLVKSFDRMSGAKAGELEKKTGLDFKRKPGSINWEEAEKIVAAIKETSFLAPSTKELKPMKEKQIREAILNVLDPEFYSIKSRAPATYRGGVPFIIEVGLAYGGNSGKKANGDTRTEIMRFANRTPLLFDSGSCVITKVVNELDWKRYKLKDLENIPLSIIVNMTSTYIPYTSAGKTAISNESDVYREVQLAIMECARDIKRYLSGKRKKHERRTRKQTLVRYVPEISRALEDLTGKKKSDLELKFMEIINKKYGDISLNGEEPKEEEHKPMQEDRRLQGIEAAQEDLKKMQEEQEAKENEDLED